MNLDEPSFGELKVIEIIEALHFFCHILHNHYNLQYNLTCDQCVFSTTTTPHLETHLMRHLDKRPFKCSICSQAIRSQPQALEHKATDHSEVESVECEKRFPLRERLAKHKQSRHCIQSHPCMEHDKTFVSKLSVGISREESTHCKIWLCFRLWAGCCLSASKTRVKSVKSIYGRTSRIVSY